MAQGASLGAQVVTRRGGMGGVGGIFQREGIYIYIYIHVTDSQVVLVVKNPPASAGEVRDEGLIPGWGRSP